MPDDRDRPSVAAAAVERLAAARTGLLVAIAIVLVGWALRAVGTIAVPLVFAFFLSLVVAPVDRWVSARVPGWLGWLGHVAAMATILLVLAVFVGALWLAAEQVTARFQGQADDLAGLIPGIEGGAGGGQSADAGNASLARPEDGSGRTAAGGEADDAASRAGGQGEDGAASAGSGGGLGQVLGRLRGAAGSIAESVSGWASSLAASILGMAGGFLSALVLVFFLTLLMLVEAPRWRGKLATLLGNPADADALEAVGMIAERLRRFLLLRLVIGAITAILYVLWIWISGLDLLLVWGLLTVLLNFIPTIGSLISGILPALYAFLTRDFGTAVMVGLGLLAIEQVMGNYVDPRLQGRTISLSALVILVALLVWGWIWGVAGAFLAVPITITLLIVGAHVPALRPVALLVSDESDMEGLERSATR